MLSSRSKSYLAAAAALAVIGFVIHRASHADQKKPDGIAPRAAVQPPPPVSSSAAVAPAVDWDARLSSADKNSFRGLIDEAMKIEDPVRRNEIVTAILDRWLAEDVHGFIAYWSSLEVGADEDRMAAVALALEQSLTKLDVERASSDEVLVVVQRLISYLVGTNPDKALLWAKRWLLDDTLESALVSVARGMARTDVDKALNVIAGMTSPLRRGQAVAAVGGIWASRDLPAATAWAHGMANSIERALTLNAVLMVGAQRDAAGSAAALKNEAQRMNEEYLRDRTARMVAEGHTEADFANDPDTYREMAASGTLPPPYSADIELMGDAGKVLGARLAAGDADAALEWSASLETDYLKLKSLSGVLEGWARTHPEAAVQYLKDHHPLNSDLLGSLYQSWAAVDYAAAADGTRLIESASLRSSALESVISTWAAKGDSGEVMAYLNDLPAAEYTDQVKLAAANAISTKSPEQAWEIARGISSENAQLRGLKAAFSNLVIQNPDQAGVLLDNATLPDKTTASLRDVLDAVARN